MPRLVRLMLGMARRVLQQAGYPQIKNLQGGILAWAEDIDQTMPKD